MLKKILRDVDHLKAILTDSINSGEFAQIDKDLVKEKLRAIYDDIIFTDCYSGEDNSTIYFDDEQESEDQNSLASFVSDDSEMEVDIVEHELDHQYEANQEDESVDSYEDSEKPIDSFVDEAVQIEEDQLLSTSNGDMDDESKQIADEVDMLSSTMQGVVEASNLENVVDNVYIDPQESEIVVYDAPLEESISDLIDDATKEQLINGLFEGSVSAFEALIAKVDSTQDFDAAVLVLQDSDINHASADISILVDALEKRFM